MPAVEPCDGPAGGIDLNRLLLIVRLTPAQAVALAADVLADLEARQAAGQVGYALAPGAARVAADGRAYLVGDKPPGGAAAPAPTLDAVAALLDGLKAATGPSAGDVDLSAALERAAAEARAPQGRLAIVAAILRTAVAPFGDQARSELARLVSAASGKLPAPPVAQPRPPGPRPTPGRRPRGPRALVRAVARRTWRWVLSIVALVLVLTAEIIFLRADIGRDVQAVLQAGRSGARPSSAPALPAVVAPAPSAAGTITRVDLRLIQRCLPGTACAVRTQVLLRPQAQPQTVTWTFRVVDRCTGTATTTPGGTVRVPARAGRIDVVNTVALPRANALAVLAMTGQPFQASSEPVYVPAQGACRR